MRILIYGINFPPDEIGAAKYTGEMSAWLVQRGHEVRAVTAPPYYPAWRVRNGYSSGRYQRESWHGMALWRCPTWVPSSPTGINRVIHAVSFALSSAPLMLRQACWKPNVVWMVVPSLFIAPVALITARLSRARAWLHLQDFEVDAAFETGLLRRPVLRRLALGVERRLLRRFDRVSTISRNMIACLIDKGVSPKRCVFFPNWVDSEAIHPLPGPNPFRRELGIPDQVAVALYSGNMSEKQGLETVLDAARRLKDDASLRFVLCGEGSARMRLVQRYGHLSNLIWLPLQPIARLNDLLNLADIHLLPQRAGVADLVMPSKLTGILASGRPVIATAVAGTHIHEVVSGCGIVVPPEDDEALAEAILRLARDHAERRRLGEAARIYAVNNIESVQILHEFERALASCLQNETK